MLTEQFIASTGVPLKPPPTSVAKDAAIFIHEFQPLQAQKSIFKKSATPPHCLAISDSHIFAAQAGKAVVHVYSRSQGNQEATVPFTERITCLALACEDTVLILGTTEGRLFLWETSSGRQVSTSQSHLQAVNRVVVDPTENFILSASEDSTVQVWSLPGLLSFTSSGAQVLSPIRTFSPHRAGICDLAVGHGNGCTNFAVSASKDNTCFVWDYYSGNVLKTYLLPELPTCLALDAADRAIYVGYEDGSVQQLDLYKSSSADASAPIQPPPSTHWKSHDSSVGKTLSMSLSFDSCTLLSGHESGNILSWDVAKGGYATSILQHPLPGPVNCLGLLPVLGFVGSSEVESKVRLSTVVKPKFGAFDSASGLVPGNYTQTVQLLSDTSDEGPSAFQLALTAPSFPAAMLNEGLQELQAFRKGPQTNGAAANEEAADFMALDDESDQPKQLSLEEQNTALKAELEALRRLQAASLDKVDRLNAERRTLLERDQKHRRGVSMALDGRFSSLGADDSSSSDDG
ncbi:Pre-rRNA-processing protein ipi3 [Saxophila tyrrhenica]|uniref:Pre-rRNA-processing protein IPI3 n=1 Tax=Saxophila tyrrhenica TaxID=1690608 RepID=A0AAV9NY67_9PEZI|nr:Pre-rRNA-processing protein ipi3 [Saxophila tyrrhenica]